MSLGNGGVVCFKQGSKSKHMPHLSIVSIVSLISRKKSKKFCIFKRNQETHKNKQNKKPTSHKKNQKAKWNKSKTKKQFHKKLSIIKKTEYKKVLLQNTYLYGIKFFIRLLWRLKRNAAPFGFNMMFWVFHPFPTPQKKFMEEH